MVTRQVRCYLARRRARSLQFVMRSAAILILAVFGATACSKAPETTAPPIAAQSPKPPQPTELQRPPVDACALLTSEEIAAVQGAPVSTATPTTRSQNGMALSQCYFGLPTAADSLSLIVYQKSPEPLEKTPLIMWKEMFHVQRPVKIGREGKPKAQPTPQKIEGLGDEAFWGGGQFGGTLHVLKGDDMFQLSVGGPGDEAAKLEKLKLLAAKIAERL